MTVSLTHSTPADGTFSATGATAWNAEHVLTQATARLLGRTTAGTGATEEISVGTGLSLSGGTLTNTATATAPGGSTTQLQYNNASAFAGASGLTTNGTELTIASGTKTASAPLLDMTQTWNNAAVTFTGLKLNVINTASNASSALMDLQVGSTSQFAVSRIGTASATGSFSSYASGGSASPNFWAASNTGSVAFGGSLDAFLSRRGAANLRLGAADAAAPVAQTLSVQSVVAGTTNIAGANLTITGSQGTGTGAGGSIIFQVAPAGSSGSAQNSLVTFLEATSTRAFNLHNTTDATTNYERGFMRWVSNVLEIGADFGGTGTNRHITFKRNTTNIFSTSGTAEFNVNVNAYFAGEIQVTGADYIRWQNRCKLYCPADAILQISAHTAANGATLQLLAMTAPAAPSANAVRIYAVDNGAGKTQLMARFASGAAQQIAIEP